MEESLSSVRTHCRKRKEYPPSTPFSGRLTRNKSQIYVHNNRSGRARFDGFLRKPISIPPNREPAMADLGVSPPNTLQGSCIKDLRRQRIFIPEVNSNVEYGNREEDMSVVKELFKGSNVVSGQIPDLGVLDLEMDGSQTKVLSEEVIEEISDPDLVNSQIEENDENLNEELLEVSDSGPVPDAGRSLGPVSDPSHHQNSKDVTVSGNGSICKAVVASCKRRKVFVTPSSFSYRRLLPYLNNMVDEEFNAGISNTMEKPIGLESEVHKVAESDSNSKVESFSDGGEKLLVNLSLSCNQQDLNGVGNELDQSNEMIVENLASKSDGSSMEEEFGQMTPSDPDFISNKEVGSSGETSEDNIMPTENQICEEISNSAILKESKSRTSLNNRMEEDKRENVIEGIELLKKSDGDPDTGRILDSFVQEAGQIYKSESSYQKSNDGTNSGNGSISKAKVIVGPCKRRKVFISPSSFSYRRLLPYLNNVADDDCSISKLETVAPLSDTLQKPVVVDCEVRPVADNAYVSEAASHSDHTKPLETEDQTTERIKQTEVEPESFASRSDGSSMEEESIQMTPPDPDLVSTMMVGVDGEATIAENMSIENQLNEDFMVVEERSNHASLKEVIKSTSPNNRMGLNPCRLRVFKNPKSFSYRRLLPFLSDMAKNDSSTSTIFQQQKPVSDLKEDTPPLSSPVTEENSANEILTQISDEKQPTETSNQNLVSAITPTVTSSPETNSNSSTISLSSSENLSDVEPLQSVSETTPEVNLQITPSNVESELLQNESSGVASVHNKMEDPTESINNASVTPPKGILKRNPRGCRGPCNCLNCASFRLHSERAFEFSLNQMRDAEEIASELMKEVASLRHLLKQSVIEKNDLEVPKPHSNSVEVRQACHKALETENRVKARLSQLNYELSIHCRVPDLVQPGVTFANYVQEKAIPRLPRK